MCKQFRFWDLAKGIMMHQHVRWQLTNFFGTYMLVIEALNVTSHSISIDGVWKRELYPSCVFVEVMTV